MNYYVMWSSKKDSNEHTFGGDTAGEYKKLEDAIYSAQDLTKGGHPCYVINEHWDHLWENGLLYPSLVGKSSWVLRITEYKDKPVPVLVVKECSEKGMVNRGLLYGQPLRRCLPVIRTIIGSVRDDAEIPLELHRFLKSGRIIFRGNLPLDEEAGAKLSLIFKLQKRLTDMDRVELIARRVERFSREEAAYWLTRITQYGDVANSWAKTGLRIMLCGQSSGEGVVNMLEKVLDK